MTARQYQGRSNQLQACVGRWDGAREKWYKVEVEWKLPKDVPIDIAGNYLCWQVFAACCVLWRQDMPVELLLFMRDIGQFRRLVWTPLFRFPDKMCHLQKSRWSMFCRREFAEQEKVRSERVMEVLFNGGACVDLRQPEEGLWGSSMIPEYLRFPSIRVKRVAVQPPKCTYY